MQEKLENVLTCYWRFLVSTDINIMKQSKFQTIKIPIGTKILDVETYRNNLRFILLYPSKIDDYFRIHKCYHIRSRIQHISLSNMLLITS